MDSSTEELSDPLEAVFFSPPYYPVLATLDTILAQ
jgi:hypothetical protein